MDTAFEIKIVPHAGSLAVCHDAPRRPPEYTDTPHVVPDEERIAPVVRLNGLASMPRWTASARFADPNKWGPGNHAALP